MYIHVLTVKKSFVITIGSPVLGSVGCLRPNSSAMTIVSSNGSRGNCHEYQYRNLKIQLYKSSFALNLIKTHAAYLSLFLSIE